MAFPPAVLVARFDIQGGVCARCGKRLSIGSFKPGRPGAWRPHHLQNQVPDDSLENCAILCTEEPENCHTRFAHAGETPIPVPSAGDLNLVHTTTVLHTVPNSLAPRVGQRVLMRGVEHRVVWVTPACTDTKVVRVYAVPCEVGTAHG